MDKGKIFVIGFDKSVEINDRYPSDFIASYEKSDCKCQIFAISCLSY